MTGAEFFHALGLGFAAVLGARIGWEAFDAAGNVLARLVNGWRR